MAVPSNLIKIVTTNNKDDILPSFSLNKEKIYAIKRRVKIVNLSKSMIKYQIFNIENVNIYN